MYVCIRVDAEWGIYMHTAALMWRSEKNFPEWVVFYSRMGRSGGMLNSGWQAHTESPFTCQPPWLPHLCVFKSLKMRFDSGLSSAFYLGFSRSLTRNNNTHLSLFPLSTKRVKEMTQPGFPFSAVHSYY